MRVLVIDDNPADQDLLAIAHERSGLDGEIVPWKAGNEVLAWVRENAHTADVVVVDLNMPRVHGIQIIAMLRSEFTDPPAIVALSGSENPRDRSGALAAGADLYLVKPNTFDAWSEIVEQIFALG
jgi:CheY-like chemotaxis protein